MALEQFRIRFGKLVTEIIGTTMLVCTIQLAGDNAAIATSMVLIALVYAGGPISGSHYNPAVSLAFFLRGSIKFEGLILYWLFQMIGAVAGAILGAAIRGGSVIAPARGAEYYVLQAFLAELVFTALLAYTYLATRTNSKVEGNSYYGIAIGLVTLVGSYCVAPISGAVFNPAITVSLCLVKFQVAYILWSILAQAAGGIAGALLFYIVAPDEFMHINEEAHNILRRGNVQAAE